MDGQPGATSTKALDHLDFCATIASSLNHTCGQRSRAGGKRAGDKQHVAENTKPTMKGHLKRHTLNIFVSQTLRENAEHLIQKLRKLRMKCTEARGRWTGRLQVTCICSAY